MVVKNKTTLNLLIYSFAKRQILNTKYVIIWALKNMVY
jgi:hypothetical protein